MENLIFERPTHNNVILKWTFNNKRSVDSIMVQLQSLDIMPMHWVFHIPPDTMDTDGRGEFRVPLELLPGRRYFVHVCGLSLQTLPGGTMGYKCVKQVQGDFRSELTNKELLALHQLALKYMAQHPPNYSVCQYMTRNKLEEYFDDIMQNKTGIMEKYLKDNNGDKAGIINGQISGLFFATRVDIKTGLPPLISCFGPKRLNVPAQLILTKSVNMYFSDFYCHNVKHYVTLVLCEQGSPTDKYCEEKLLPVDKYDNAFLWISKDRSICVTQNVLVEVFYTEDVDIPRFLHNGAFWTTVISTGISIPEGIPKNACCKICNLYPRNPEPRADERD